MSKSSLANSRTAYHESTTLYRRINGRYVAVSDPWASEGLREGYWLVHVRPGCTSTRTCVWPDKPEVEAALHDLENQLVDLIREAAASRPAKQKLTPAEKRAWDNLAKVGGDSFSTLSGPSFQSIADAIVGKVRERIEAKARAA